MRAWWLVVILALVAALPARAEDEAALDRDAALALLQEAARISPAYLRTLTAIDRETARKILYTVGADAPLTAAVIAMADGGELEEDDFRWLEHATPREFFDAIYPTMPIRTAPTRTAPRPKHAHASVLHPELVRKLDVASTGDRAHGTIEFGKDGIFKGFAHWQAVRGAKGAWRITEIAFRDSHVRVVRVGARWRLDAAGLRSRINPRRGHDLTLPRVGTVGIEPPAEHTILISVTEAGYIHLGASETRLSMRALGEELTKRAAPADTREPDGSCRLAVLLDVDAATPWAVVQWLMQTCAHPAVKIHKVYFGARAQTDGAEGALAARLPKDRSGPVRSVAPPPRVRVKTFHGDRDATDPRALFAALRKIPITKRRAAIWEIAAPPPHGGKVPHGTMLQVMDAMIAAGATNIVFEGAAAPMQGNRLWSDPEAMAERILALKAIPGNAYVKLGSTRLGKDAPTRDIPQIGRVERTVGGVAFDEPDARASAVWLHGPEILEETPDSPLADDVTAMDLRRARAIRNGLTWLAAHQSPDGGWEAATFMRWCDGKERAAGEERADGAGKPVYDVGVTGLALTAFLAAGYTNRGKHPFAKVVSRGLRYLKNQQDPEGCFGRRSTSQYVYGHAAAAYAMVDAYGRTRSPIFKGSAQRALDFVALTRNPYFAWRYGVKPGDNDTSVTAWMLRVIDRAGAINKAATAAGRPAPLTVDASAFDGANAWLEKMYDPQSGRFGYVARGASPPRPKERLDAFPAQHSESTTAAGVACRLMAGAHPKQDRMVIAGGKLIMGTLPRWNVKAGSIDLAYWVWGTRVAWRLGVKRFVRWRAALDQALLAHQRRGTDRCAAGGSWDPTGVWGADGGRVYATSMALLALLEANR